MEQQHEEKDGFIYPRAEDDEDLDSEDDSEGSEIEIPDITLEKPEFDHVRKGNLSGIQDFLDRLVKEDIKGYVNEMTNRKGDTLVHTAVDSGQTIALELLVSFGATGNSYNKDGFTPLHLAAKKNSPQMTKILLKGGSSPNLPSKDKIYNGYTPLHFACLRESLEVAQVLVKEFKADVNQSTRVSDTEHNDNRTPLHVACNYCEHLDLVKLLVDEGAKLTNIDEGGYSPLSLAVVKGKAAIVSYLAKLSSSVINTPDTLGDTALHHAFQVQLHRLFHNSNWLILPPRQNLALALIRCGADLTVKNKEGKTALDYTSPSSQRFFQLAASSPKLLAEPLSLDEILENSQKIQLENEAKTKEFRELSILLLKEQKEAVEEDEASGACPFMKPKKGAVTASQCPYGYGTPEATLKEGKCPIPFHRQLMDPKYWVVGLGLSALTGYLIMKYKQ